MTGGSGGPDDLDAVARAAERLPAPVIRRFRRKGVRVVACRGSVTDFERSLRGVVPRGWEGLGKTWDDVPGAYLPHRRRVVVGTVDSGGRREVPPAGRGHGSADLVVHEALHGFDYDGGHAVLADPAFVNARQADLDRLGSYERQPGRAGAEETFAESGARFATDPNAMASSWPALHAYWTAGPLEQALERFEGEEALGGAAAIGTAEDAGGGRIALDLRADGPGGVVGHAFFVLGPGDQGYERLAGTVFAEGRAPGGPVLVWPLGD